MLDSPESRVLAALIASPQYVTKTSAAVPVGARVPGPHVSVSPEVVKLATQQLAAELERPDSELARMIDRWAVQSLDKHAEVPVVRATQEANTHEAFQRVGRNIAMGRELLKIRRNKWRLLNPKTYVRLARKRKAGIALGGFAHDALIVGGGIRREMSTKPGPNTTPPGGAS